MLALIDQKVDARLRPLEEMVARLERPERHGTKGRADYRRGRDRRPEE